MQMINPGVLIDMPADAAPMIRMAPGAILFVLAATAMSAMMGTLAPATRTARVEAGYRRTPFGHVIHAIVGNQVMPLVSIGAVIGFVIWTFAYFGENNNGV